ncbi:MAG TPA: hypothetical protein VLT89_11135 [Usitatibacter sp.]|nr:hypothetical protein [Usitatibacter sp.]
MNEHVAVVSAEHPWPGLMPFTEEAQAFFHGRDAEVAELLRLIKRETLTVLFGLSGLGKSSLLNAGLFPQLRREDFHPVYLRVDVLAGQDLVEQALLAIEASCIAHRIEAPARREGDTLWEYFHRRDSDFWSARNRLVTPVLVLDQFEEVFTLGRSDDAIARRCREFIEQVADLTEGRVPARVAARLEADPSGSSELDFGRRNCKVVMSFREDYLPDFEALRAAIPSIMRSRLRLTRMNGLQAREAVLKSGGHLVTEAVGDLIIRFVASPRSYGADAADWDLERLEVEPALLSVVCRELNNKRIRMGRAQISSDLLEGGAQHEIIREFYEASLEGIDPRAREFIEDQLLTEAGYRDSYALDDALRLPGITRPEIDRLIARRLLRLDERSGVLRVELTHDVLTRVAKESRDLRQARVAERRAAEADAARKRRTRRFAIAGGAVVATAIGLAALFAVLLDRSTQEKHRLIETQSNVILEQAISLIDRNVPGEPQAMLAASLRLNPGNTAAAARVVTYLTQRSFARPVAVVLISDKSNRRDLHLSWADASHLAVEGPGGAASIDLSGGSAAPVVELAERAVPATQPAPAEWSATIQRDVVVAASSRTGARWTLRHPSPVNAFAFSRDGRWLATGCQDKRARVWDLQTGGLVGTPLEHEGAVLSLAFNADGRFLVTGSLDRTARIWSMPSGRQVLEALIDTSAVLDARMSPDAARVATLDAASRITIWDVDTKAGESPPALTADRQLRAASPDGRLIASELRDPSGAVSLALGPPPGAAAQGWKVASSRGSPPLAFSEDGRRIAMGLTASTVEVRNGADGTPAAPRVEVPDRVDRIALDRQGGQLATVGEDGAVRIWDLRDGTLRGLPIPSASRVAHLAFDGEGRLLAVADESGYVDLWDTDSTLRLVSLAPAMGGARIAFVGFTAAQGELVIVDERVARAIVLEPPEDMSYDKGLARGDLTARERGRVTFLNSVWSADLSPASHRLVVGGIDGVARVVDLDEMRLTGAPMKHDGVVLAATFAEQGRWILTRTENAVRLWDGRNGYAVADELRLPARVTAAALVSGGALLLSQETAAPLRAEQVDLDFPLPPAKWLPAIVEVQGGSHFDKTGSITPLEDPGREHRAVASAVGEEPVAWWKSWGEGVLARQRPQKAREAKP